jgi:hypothetical protein
MSSWGKSKIESLFDGLSAPLQSGGVTGLIKAGEVSEVTGDASIAVVRGAKRCAKVVEEKNESKVPHLFAVLVDIFSTTRSACSASFIKML